MIFSRRFLVDRKVFVFKPMLGFMLMLIGYSQSSKSFNTTYADSLWKVAENKKDEKALHFILDNFYSVFSRNPEDGMKWTQIGLYYAERSKNQQLIGRSYLNIGMCNYLKGDYIRCLENYQQALQIFELIGDQKYIGRTCNELSVYSRKQKHYQQGLHYLDRSYSVCIVVGDSGCIETSLNNRAVIYEMMGEYDLAMTYYNKAAIIAQKSNNLTGLAYIYSDAAECARLKKDYDSSAILIDLSIAIMEKIDNQSGLAMNLTNKGELFYLQNKFNDAILTLIQAKTIAEKINYTDLLKSIHYQMAKSYAKLHIYDQSFFHIERSYFLQDSLLNYQKLKSISEMEVKYQTEKIENEYLKEQQKRISGELKLANRNKWLIIISALSLTSLFLFLFLYQIKIKKAQAEKDRAIIKEREAGLKAVFEATEEERKRIAKDLHDGIGQQMSGIKLAWQNLSISVKGLSEEEQVKILELSKILDQTAAEVRTLSHRMMPKVLEEFGLIPAIEEMLENTFKLSPIKFSFEHFHISERYDQRIEISLFRICQELVNNIIKHSGANFMSVQLFQNQNHLILIVEDNGKGIDKKSASDGHGLINIKSRLNTINGQVNVEASANAGTTATIRVKLS